MNNWESYFNQIHGLFRNNYKTKGFIIQKDINFPSTPSETRDFVEVIDCADIYKVQDIATLYTDKYANSVMNSTEMVKYMGELFGELGFSCELGRGYSSEAVYADNFIRNFHFECHGSGANATFYLVYRLIKYLHMCDQDEEIQPRIIINNYESFLHYLSAEKWLKLMLNVEELNFCILANNYSLFNIDPFFDEEDPWKHLFVINNGSIKNITEFAELRKAHNLEKMLKDGVFGEDYKIGG